MKVKFTKDTDCCLGGIETASFKKGEEKEVSDKLGKLLIDGKQATLLKGAKAREKATKKPNETA